MLPRLHWLATPTIESTPPSSFYHTFSVPPQDKDYDPLLSNKVRTLITKYPTTKKSLLRLRACTGPGRGPFPAHRRFTQCQGLPAAERIAVGWQRGFSGGFRLGSADTLLVSNAPERGAPGPAAGTEDGNTVVTYAVGSMLTELVNSVAAVSGRAPSWAPSESGLRESPVTYPAPQSLIISVAA
eukprot:762747-Hanusia_phi.AAC.1